ncbi:N-acetyltransferase [Paracidovorax avenae]|uniref:GNAT family N-acetyltransferase n=1 Tax=Paracidovorax avenae TaxID=80867 RepID=UPI000D20AE46|nr:GNAT family N-acetyltransferase [Paracidovorax avenae]AVS82845.1 N-acetyltransferase [Paracidovorax avenae]
MKARIQILTTREAWAACSVVRASIAECCFPDHHGDPQVMHTWLANKTPENFEAWFAAPQAIPLGAFDGDKLVGVALVSGSSLSLCYVTVEALRRRIGRSLLHAAENLTRGRGIEELHLESTRTAEAFYLRHGFQPSGPVKLRAGMQALPMSKHLGKALGTPILARPGSAICKLC